MNKQPKCNQCPEQPVLSRKKKRNVTGSTKGEELVCPICEAKYPLRFKNK